MPRLLIRAGLLLLGMALLQALSMQAAPASGEKMVVRMKRPAAVNTARGKAMWVVRHSLLSRESIDRMVARAIEGGINTLFVQVCGRGDSYFPSRVFPPAEDYLLRVGNSFDPLAYVLDKAHSHGIAVHAWTNTLLVWSSPKAPLAPGHMINAHPEWSMVDIRGDRMTDYPFDRFGRLQIEGVFRSLAEPESSRDLEKFLLDLVTRYPLDGLHLDYIRYPYANVDFSGRVREEFSAAFGKDPLNLVRQRPEIELELGSAGYDSLYGKWLAYRAELITAFVRRLHGHLEQVRPSLSLSAAVKPDIASAYKAFGQDWPLWVREGLIDFVVPMSYSTNAQVVFGQIQSACNAVGPEHVWAGLRAWDVPVTGVIERLRRVSALGPGGISFFSYNGMEKNDMFFNSVKLELIGW